MNIDELTIGQIREIKNLGVCKTTESTPFEVGRGYLIRTVTMTWTGRVTGIKGDFLCLEDAAWIANTGRFNEAAKGKIKEIQSSEVEPVPNGVFIGMGAIVDAIPWDYPMLRETK